MIYVVIIGIDPSLSCSGWAVVNASSSAYSVVASGAIRTSPADSLQNRLLSIYSGIYGVIAAHQPQAAACEGQYLGPNVRTLMDLSCVRGVVLLACAQAGVECAVYPPSCAKMDVAGSGRATKKQVRAAVEQLTGWRARSYDRADAASIALCRAMRQ